MFCEGGMGLSSQAEMPSYFTKTYSGMAFYSSNLTLTGVRSLNYLGALAKCVITYQGCPQVIT